MDNKDQFLPSQGTDPKMYPVDQVLHLPSGPEVIAAIRYNLELPEEGFTYNISRGPTNMLRPWSCVVDVRTNGSIAGSFLIKPKHSVNEIEASLRASRLGIGPKVIYSSTDIFVEEFFKDEQGDHRTMRARERTGSRLTEEEQIALGSKLADVEFAMFEDTRPFGKPILQGGTYVDHLLFVGKGKDIRPLFVDWGQIRVPQDEKIRQMELIHDIKAMTQAIDPKSFAYFITRLNLLAQEDGKYTENFYDESYGKARKDLATTKPLSKRYTQYFQQVDNEIEQLPENRAPEITHLSHTDQKIQ